MAIGLSLFAFSRQRAAEASRQEAEAAEREALRQASIGLAAQALAQLDGDAPERGVLLALAALEAYPYTPQAESALAQTVYGTHQYTALPIVSPRVSAIEFSPDGTLIAGAHVVWDSVSGERVTEFNIPITEADNLSLDWLSDNRGLLAARVVHGGSVSVRDATSGEERLRYEYGGVNKAYASADGRQALSASADGTARIWLIASGETVRSFVGHEGSINDAIWSPEERQVATASSDGTIRIWDAQTGAELQRIDAHPDGVTALSWSSDGRRLASSGKDGLGRVWDATTGELLLTLMGHGADVRDIEWSPNDGLLATAGGDGTVRVWGSRAGLQQLTLAGSDTEVRDVSWSPSGQRLAVGGGVLPRVWDVTTPIVRLVGYETEFEAVLTYFPYWSPDSSWVGAGGASDQTYRLWDSVTGENFRTFERVLGGFGAPNPSGTEVFLVNPPRIISLETGEARHVSVPEELPDAFAIEWSPDGSLIILAEGGIPEYAVYDAETLELLFMGRGRNCSFRQIPAISPDNKYLAHICLGKSTSVLITESLTGEVVKELEGHTQSAGFASWSPDGSKLATASFDLTVRVWDVATGETLTMFTGHTANPFAVNWSPDGTRLVSGDAAGNVLIWDAETGGVVNRYNVGGSTLGNKWSPDGSRVLTTGFLDAPDIRPVWQSTEELIEYAYDCCVFRELAPEEREQFGLRPADDARASSSP